MMRNGKFHRRVAFAICTNPFHLPKNGRGGLKLVLKIMALKKWNTNFRLLGNSGNSVQKNKTTFSVVPLLWQIFRGNDRSYTFQMDFPETFFRVS